MNTLAAPNPTAHAFSLQGKRILVTGASSGIGQQVAITCAQRGAHVVATGRDAQRLQQTFDQLPGEGHMQVLADLTVAEDRARLVQACGKDLHGVVHSTGRQKLMPVRQLTESVMTQMYTDNFLAPVMLTQGLLAANAILPQGSIVFVLSTAAHMGTRGVGPYSAMKAALLGMVKCLALEQAKRKIRVNGISPSTIATPLWADIKMLLDAEKARHPLGLGTPEDVANAAVYLLADASRWVTGTSLLMNGGAMP